MDTGRNVTRRLLRDGREPTRTSIPTCCARGRWRSVVSLLASQSTMAPSFWGVSIIGNSQPSAHSYRSCRTRLHMTGDIFILLSHQLVGSLSTRCLPSMGKLIRSTSPSCRVLSLIPSNSRLVGMYGLRGYGLVVSCSSPTVAGSNKASFDTRRIL